MRTKAAARLEEITTPKREMSQAEIARRLDVSQQAVNDWLHGRSLPTPANMARLEDLLGIPMREWTEETSSGSPLSAKR